MSEEHETTPVVRACKQWREILPEDSACKIIPAYSESKLIELGRNIKNSGGMKLPVIVSKQLDGTFSLLDGRSRLDGMAAVGIKFTIQVIDGCVVIVAPAYDIPPPTEVIADENFNALVFVLSMNVHRRHLKNADKYVIAEKVIAAQPNLSDNAIAKMTGIAARTIKKLRLKGEPYSEILISRVEASGRRARGRKPGQSSKLPPTSTPQVEDKPPGVTPIAPIAARKPPARTKDFDTIVLDAVHKIQQVLNRPVSAPNVEEAQRELKRLAELVETHKTAKPNPAERAQAA
jgi:hypothetical protein